MMMITYDYDYDDDDDEFDDDGDDDGGGDDYDFDDDNDKDNDDGDDYDENYDDTKYVCVRDYMKWVMHGMATVWKSCSICSKGRSSPAPSFA